MWIQIKTQQKFQHKLLLLHNKASGVLLRKHRPTVFPGVGIPIIKVTKSWDWLILLTVIRMYAIYFSHRSSPPATWEHIYSLNSDHTLSLVAISKMLHCGNKMVLRLTYLLNTNSKAHNNFPSRRCISKCCWLHWWCLSVLTHKHLEAYSCVICATATDALVLTKQPSYLDQIHIKKHIPLKSNKKKATIAFGKKITQFLKGQGLRLQVRHEILTEPDIYHNKEHSSCVAMQTGWL